MPVTIGLFVISGDGGPGDSFGGNDNRRSRRGTVEQTVRTSSGRPASSGA